MIVPVNLIVVSTAKGHGQTNSRRRPMGTHRTVAAAAETSALSASRAQAARESRGTHGYSVHPADRFALGPATTRDGLWQRYELLAAPARLAGRWRLGRATRSAACALACSRPDRLVPGHRRLLFNSCHRCWSKTGPNPTDRARPGSKHHLITEAQGIPLAVILTGANRHDVTQLHALVDAIPPIGGKRGRPLSKPLIVQGDRGYDHDKYRRPLHAAGIATEIARRGQPHGSSLGKTRWVVERTISWLHNFRRLRIRFERLAFIHEAFLKLACCIICWRHLHNSFC